MLKYSYLLIAFLFISCYSIKKVDKNAYHTFRTTQKKFVSEHGKIAYIDQGTGDNVVLLLHGVPSSSWLYRKMIPLLVAQDYRVIAPDMLGYGASDNPKGYELYNETKHAERIIALMDTLKIKKWHHVMHDAGGLWTWEVFKQAPNRIKKLTVLNTIVYKEGFHPPVRMKKGFFAKSAMWLYKNKITTTKMLQMLFKQGLVNPDNLTKAEFYGYKKPLLESKTRGMYYFFTQTCNAFPDYSDQFKNLNIPVQFVWGKQDEMLQINPQIQLIKKGFGINDSMIHLLDAKHFIQEEKPQKIVNLITNL